MQENNSQAATPLPAPAINESVIKASINVDLSKASMQYEQTLQAATDIKFDKTNLKGDYAPLKQLRALIKKIDDLRTEKNRPYLDAQKLINKVSADLTVPLQKILDEKTKEYEGLVKEVAADNKKIADEKARVDGIKLAIDNLILTQSQAIAGASTSTELEAVRTILKANEANKDRYQEFLADLKAKIKELLPLITKQGAEIDRLEELEKERKKQLKKGDERGAMKIMDKISGLTGSIEERKITVQEKAINSTIAAGTVIVAEPIQSHVPTARRTTWKFKIVDQAELMKKAPDLAIVTLDNEKTKAVLNTLKDAGVLKDKTEHTLNGIMYYEEKLY